MNPLLSIIIEVKALVKRNNSINRPSESVSDPQTHTHLCWSLIIICLFLLSHFEIVFLLFPHIHTLCRENKDLAYFAAVNWTAGWSGRRSWSPTESGFSQGFFSVLSPMEFGFLAAVASGLLSWGHFISSNIIDLITQILFKVNWAGWWHHWIQ